MLSRSDHLVTSYRGVSIYANNPATVYNIVSFLYINVSLFVGITDSIEHRDKMG